VEIYVGVNAVIFEDSQEHLTIQGFLVEHLNERLFQLITV
jgi:hypothetical protein